jgi:perosamine synthetase
MISIYEPDIKKYTNSAINVIKNGWISGHGDYVRSTEQKLEEIMGIDHAILMSNGTCASHCMFLALRFKFPDVKIVYVPNNVYVAVYNTALMVYPKDHIEMLEMNDDTLNMRTDEEYILSLARGSAVVVVHNAGNVVNVPRLERLRPDIVFVEDACEAMFGMYENKYVGTSSLCSIFSFFPNKLITSGEGGAFLTRHKDVYDHVRSVYSQGMSTVKYVHDTHAYNYRMTNIQAALLYEQLIDYKNILRKRWKIFKTYKSLLKSCCTHPKSESGTVCLPWLFVVKIPGKKTNIEDTNSYFRERGVDIRPFFYPIDVHSHVGIRSKSAINNEDLFFIPSSSTLTLKEQIYVADVIREFARNNLTNIEYNDHEY